MTGEYINTEVGKNVNKEIDSNTLFINEIFYSIQGESTYQGEPCIFIRLAGCNLRCIWCDTTYSFSDGKKMTYEQIFKKIKDYKVKLVEITGGEPLLQKNVIQFMKQLIQKKYKLLLETSGSILVKDVPQEVVIIMDIKCPGSGESEKNLWENLNYLKPFDEIKFVVADRTDYDWMKDVIRKNELTSRFKVLVSPVYENNIARDLAKWILDDNLEVRLNLQIHKVLWGNQRGR